MNKKRKFLSFIIVLTLVFTLFPSTAEAASKVKINKTKTTIYVGKTETLKISGTNKTVKWTTSNKNVATVSSKGKVTAKKTGTTTITAKVSGKKYNCKVTVKKPYINCSSKTLYVSDTYTLKLTGTSIKSIKSSNTKVATVSNKGKVTAKKAGTATITITGKDKKTYKCKITVKNMVHKHSYTNKVIKPTCTEKGYTLYTCSCGDSYKKDYKDATGHSWGDWKVTKEPTESKEGEKTRTCISCSKKETEKIPKLEHVHNYIPTVTESTCTEQGYTIYTCSCGDSYVSDYTAAGHEWSDWIITKDPGTEVHTKFEQFGERKTTCKKCGEIISQSIINIDASNYEANSDIYASDLTFISENTIQVYGEFCDDMAYETFIMVNNLRKSLGLQEYEWKDSVLESTGKIRAAEITCLYDHERPNGQRPTVTFDNGLILLVGENIGLANLDNDATFIFNAWCNSSGHYANIISTENRFYYASCLKTNNGYTWVQLFYSIKTK